MTETVMLRLEGSSHPAVFETAVGKEGWKSTSGAIPPAPSNIGL